MARARSAALALAVAALLALAVAPGMAVAADLVAITGTVHNLDATPAAAVEVLVGVAGSDLVQPATTDPDGAFAVQLEASPGDTIEIRATGATLRSEPDDEGCIHATTPTGRTSLVLGETAPEPVEVVLDTVLEGTVCTATATPEPKPRVTPPATDAPGAATDRRSTTGLDAVLAVLGSVMAGGWVATRRRRA